jgi:Mrp family chromosome partitioning ATPase
MSRNFELLQNIGKEQEYFQPDQPVLTETMPAPSHGPFAVQDGLPAVGGAALAPMAAPEPIQFSIDPVQLAELSKVVQRLFLLPGAESNRTVVFTASDSGDGCSWICARVGELLASQITGTVCLVDANLQSPTLHEQFGVSNHHGLSDALRQGGSMRGYVSQVSRRNLALVSCGSESKDFQSMVTSDRMRMRMNELRSEFDYVLIDSPSMSISEEAISLGSVADGVVLVLKANSTRKEKARSAVHDLQASQVKVLGAVLNQRTFPIPEKLYNKL